MTMAFRNIIFALLSILLIASCSSTQSTVNVDSQQFYSSNALTNRDSEQNIMKFNENHYRIHDAKPLNSDSRLLLSMLNRPMTDDLKLMLAFAQQDNINTTGSAYINIVGPKTSVVQINNAFQPLIDADPHAVNIRGNSNRL